MNKPPVKEEREPRSGVLLRYGKVSEPVEDRMYQSQLPGSQIASIETLLKVLKNKFDLLVLHDTIDDCLIVNMETQEVGVLQCRIHHADKYSMPRQTKKNES